jgi:PIN like domain
VRLLVDHNVSPYIARALAVMAEPDGHEVKAKRDKFEASVPIPDTEWLGVLGREGGWAFLSDDHRIYSNPQERGAMLAARVIGFFLEPAWRKRNVTEYERAARLILWLPRLAQQCEAVAPPAAYKLPFRHTSRLRPIALPSR